MANCKYCGNPLILSGGKCVYCGASEMLPKRNNMQQVINGTKQFVDLGLPSGTKWASCNLGATKPWENGGYYAWGEIEEKTFYNEKTYRWGPCNPKWKYCNDAFCEVIDNKWVLENEDDAARVKWGGNWRMPTLDDFKELLYSCHNEWATMNNVRGLKLVSKINGESIFFPAAGLRMDNGHTNKHVGYYKTSTLYEKNSQDAYVFLFITETISQSREIMINPNLRVLGQSIRPVFL